VHEKRPARTWLVRILVQLYPRVLGLPAAVLLVSAVRGGEGCDEHGVDQQVQKPMHAAGAARAAGVRCLRLFKRGRHGANYRLIRSVITGRPQYCCRRVRRTPCCRSIRSPSLDVRSCMHLRERKHPHSLTEPRAPAAPQAQSHPNPHSHRLVGLKREVARCVARRVAQTKEMATARQARRAWLYPPSHGVRPQANTHR
jgi:hypothetical protein